jgi:hypothetical protein
VKVALQPAGSKDSRRHYRDTVETPVIFSEISPFLGSERGALAEAFPNSEIAFWGVTPGKRNVNVGKYNQLGEGDLVVFLRDKQAFAWGRISLLFQNRELAAHLWGYDSNGMTWEFIYAVKDVKNIDIPYSALRAAIASSDGDNFMGFRVVSGMKAAAVGALLGVLREDPTYTGWNIQPGQSLLRSELHDRYGGARRGGIEPSSTSPNVFLFSDPSVGTTYGYDFDGPGIDGDYFFTGDGQIGPQRDDAGGNKSLMEAEASGRAIRLFTKSGREVTYVGEFELAYPPYEVRRAPDRDGSVRDVLVFHLLPVGGQSIVEVTEDLVPVFSSTQVERTHVVAFDQTRGSLGQRSLRKESQLRDDFVRWSETKGRELRGGKLTVPGLKGSLTLDLFDERESMVIEAKSSASRVHMRQAIGQVLDYQYLVRAALGRPISAGILTPQRPSKDLLELLHVLDIKAIFRTADGFETSR